MKQTDSFNWMQYEELVKYIFEAIGRLDGIKIIGHGNTCKVIGDSGSKYQIDVLTEQILDNQSVRTAIECKYWNKKVNRDVVMKLVALLDDTKIHKGVIVSKVGFTSDAIKYAEHKSIKLVELGDIANHNIGKSHINLFDLDLFINVEITTPEIIEVVIDDVTIKDRKNIFGALWYGYVYINNTLHRPFKDYISQFQKELRDNDEVDVIKSKEFELPIGALYRGLYLDNNKPIQTIKITGKLAMSKENHKKEYTIVDKIWLIMKDVFDDKMHAITLHGAISHMK